MCSHHHTLLTQGSEACSRILRAWGSLHASAKPPRSESRGAQALAKGFVGRGQGLAIRVMQKQGQIHRSKGQRLSWRPLGRGKLRPVGGEGLGGL